MTFSATLTLFAAMVVLASIPGPGIMIVVARSVSQGFVAGLVTSVGIVLGDFVFITVAVYGLSALSQFLGGFFLIVKYAGAAYLIWLGLKIVLSKAVSEQKGDPDTPKHTTNLIAGLLTTLSNPKAILFYVSFFPTFIDLSSVGYMDLGLIFLVATMAVGGVMAVYAYLAVKSKLLLSASSRSGHMKYLAGGLLLSSGVYIAARA